MSGQKCAPTRTPRAVTNQARTAASNNQNRRRTVQSSVSRANQRVQNRLNIIEENNRIRENNIRNTINGLSGSLRQAEEKRLQDLIKQNRHFEGRMKRQSQKVQAQILNEQKLRRAELQKTKTNLESQMRNEVGKERLARRKELEKVNSQINTLDKSLRQEIKNLDSSIRKDLSRQKNYLEARMDSLVGEEREVREREIQRIDNNIQQLDNAINEVDQKLDSEISRVETNFKDMLKIEAEQRRIQIDNLQQWTANNFENQRKEYLDITQQQQREIEVNRSAIEEIFDKIDTNSQAARTSISSLQKIVNEGYEANKEDFEKYTPGDINNIIRRSNRAVDELNNGAEQVAKSEAINAYEAWLEMNKEMDKKKKEFEFWHQETLKEILSLFEIIKLNREEGHRMHGDKNAIVDGKEVEVYVDSKVELDYWTEGKFSELEKEVVEEMEKIQHPESISIEEIREIKDRIDALKVKEQNLIITAEEKVISSQMRAELGDIAVEALQKEGFELGRSGYDKGEQLRGYIVNLTNRGGADVVVSILPTEDVNKNILDIQIKNEFNYSDAETKVIVKSITSILKDVGIDIGDVECKQAHLDEFYDFDKIFSKDGGLPVSEIKRKGGII